MIELRYYKTEETEHIIRESESYWNAGKWKVIGVMDRNDNGDIGVEITKVLKENKPTTAIFIDIKKGTRDSLLLAETIEVVARLGLADVQVKTRSHIGEKTVSRHYEPALWHKWNYSLEEEEEEE